MVAGCRIAPDTPLIVPVAAYMLPFVSLPFSVVSENP